MLHFSTHSLPRLKFRQDTQSLGFGPQQPSDEHSGLQTWPVASVKTGWATRVSQGTVAKGGWCAQTHAGPPGRSSDAKKGFRRPTASPLCPAGAWVYLDETLSCRNSTGSVWFLAMCKAHRISPILSTALWCGNHYYLHFMDEEAKAQRFT